MKSGSARKGRAILIKSAEPGIIKHQTSSNIKHHQTSQNTVSADQRQSTKRHYEVIRIIIIVA